MIDWETGAKMKVQHMNRQAEISLITRSDVKSPRMFWIAVYDFLVRTKKIIPIEQMEASEKLELKSFARESCDGKGLTVDEMVDVCRCFVAVEYYLTNQ